MELAIFSLTLLKEVKMRIAIIGRSEFLYSTAELLLKNGYKIPLVITHKEAPEYTKTAKDFEELANNIGAKYIYTNRIENYIDEIKSLGKIDIGVSVNFPTIIPQEVIELFPLGILNAHAGDLPRYRGNACVAWAILNGESKIGLCIHKMEGGKLDIGDIIVREYFPININTKITECMNWARERVPLMFLDAIKKLENNPNYVLEVPSKDPKDSLRCYPRLPEDGRIDWHKSNIEILRLINASNKPYSGAFCFYDDKKMIIWDAELYEDDERYIAEVGQIASINKEDGSIVVITGKGKLKIKEIEYESKVCKPAEIIKSIRKRLK